VEAYELLKELSEVKSVEVEAVHNSRVYSLEKEKLMKGNLSFFIFDAILR
jgi:hypothetical protein